MAPARSPRGAQLKIREYLKEIDEASGDKRIPASAVDADGEIDESEVRTL